MKKSRWSKEAFGQKRGAIALLTVLLSLLTAAGIFLVRMEDPLLAAPGDAWVLNNFTTGASIKDSEGNIVPPGGSVIVGNRYTLSVSFKESPGMQFQYNGAGRLLYQLDSGITIPAAVTNAPVFGVGASKPVIGHYNLTTGGVVTVWFDQVNENGVSVTPLNFIDYYTNANFTMEFSVEFTTVGGPFDFDFGNNIDIDITVKPIEPYPVIKKSSGTFNPVDDTIQYTVAVTAKNDDLTIKTLSDWARKTGSGGNQNLGALPAPAYLNLSSVVVKNNGVTVPSSQYAISWKSGSNPPAFEIVFNGSGITIAKDKNLTVEYTMDLTNFITNTYGISNCSFTVHNEATVSYPDTNGNTKTATATQDVPITKTFVSKTGTFTPSSPGATTGSITWTIKIGNGATNLAGVTVTDTLGAGFVPADRPATVNVKGHATSSGAAIWTEASVATSLGAGSSFSFVVPNSHGAVYYVSITYTIPGIDILGPNRPSNYVYLNTVAVDLPGNPSATGKLTQKPTAPIGVDDYTKEVAFLNENTLQYKISIRVPAVMSGDLYFLEDLLYIHTPASGNANLTYVVYTPQNMKISYNGGTEYPVTEDFSPTGPGYEDNIGMARFEVLTNDLYHTFRLTFNNADSSTMWTDGIWPSGITSDTDVIITYEVPLSSPLQQNRVHTGSEWHDLPIGTTLGELLRNYPQYEVINRLQHSYRYDGTFHYGTPVAVVKIGWPVFKKAYETQQGSNTIFNYEVSINHVQVSNNLELRSTFQLFEYGSPAIFFDTLDERMEYVPGSFRVYLRMNDGADYNCAKYGYPGAGDVSYDPAANTITADFRDLRFQYDATLPPAYVGVQNVFNVPDWYAQAGPVAMVACYQLKLKDDVLETLFDPVELKNTAGYEGTASDHSGHFTNDCIHPFDPKPVKKDLFSLHDNIASFDITINPYGVKLDGGNNLCVTDKMNNTLAFYLTSIEAFRMDAGGNYTIAQPLTQTPTLNPNAVWTWALTGQNEITFVFPDETPLKLKYNALLKGEAGDTVEVENYVEISGKYYDDYKDSWLVSDSTASGGGSFEKFLLLKNDATNVDKALPGAEFALYIGWDPVWPGGNGPYGGIAAPVPSGGAPATFTEDGYTYYYLKSDTTGPSGSILFDSSWLTADSTGAGAKYAVLEISPPFGYNIMPSGPTTIVDLFSSSGTDYITVSNDPKVTTVTLNGQKVIQGSPSPGNMPSSFHVDLLQVTDETGNTPKTPIYQDDDSVSGAGDFSFTLANLGPNTYYYMITEAPGAPGTDWIYDDTIYIVKVTVDVDSSGDLVTTVESKHKKGATGTWSVWSVMGSGGKLTFTNIYEEPTGTLTLEKLVTGDGADLDKDFSFEVAFSAPVIRNAEPFTTGTVTLKHGHSTVFSGIPYGTTYTVTEADYSSEGYSADDPGLVRTGSITASNIAVTVTYTNTYEEPGIPFSFTKTGQDGKTAFGAGEAVFELHQFSCAQSHTHVEFVTGGTDCCWELLDTQATDADGVVTFELLVDGQYMLVETKTKPGYQLPHGQWLVTIDAHSDPQYIIWARGEQYPPAFRYDADADKLYLPNLPQFVTPRTGSVTGLLFSSSGAAMMIVTSFFGLSVVRRRRRKLSV